MPATNTATPTETKQTAEQIPQPKEPTKGFDPDSIRAFLKKLTQKKYSSRLLRQAVFAVWRFFDDSKSPERAS